MTPTEEWTLVEWSVDHSTQSFRFFINGEEIKEMGFNKGEGQFAGAEIPAVFENRRRITAWFEDIALSKERIDPTRPSLAAKKK